MCFTLQSALSLACPTEQVSAILLNRFANKLSLYAQRCDISPLGAQVFLDSGACLAFLTPEAREEAVSVCQAMNVCHYWADWAPTVEELRDGRRDGVLLSSSAVVLDAQDRWLLVQRDTVATVEPGKWHFPGMRAQTLDAPEAAVRALCEELSIADLRSGLSVDRSEWTVEDPEGEGRTVTLYVDGRVNHQHQASFVLDQTCNTLEQFVGIRLSGPSLWYDPRDRVFGRQVAFMEPEAALARECELAMSLRRIAPYWSDGRIELM